MFAFIVETRACVRVTDLQREFGMTERSIQRLFDDCLGVSPKLAIRTVRFQDALKGVLAANISSWADFAAALGYADQAHFIRDFKEITATTPAKLDALQFPQRLSNPYGKAQPR